MQLGTNKTAAPPVIVFPNDHGRAAATQNMKTRERFLRRLLCGDGFVMVVGVRLGRLVGVMLGVQIMRAGKMRMMAGDFMLAVRRVFGGFAMMMRGVFVMLGRMLVMFGGAFGVSHGRLLVSARVLRVGTPSAILRQQSDETAFAAYISLALCAISASADLKMERTAC
jgi:ABC-type antimicrobial peptide transport system permease subunit